ncbi:MAG TPA: succinate--CoA ligase subunit alpha [Thermomicrobiaceae bacterium]|nr:succinate--CoA ligase subunit alpha [Thermomicrobiaceae bacterium]
MAVLVNDDTRLLVQGITGREGSFHTGQMVEYGTKVVAGVTPGRAGQEVHGVPVFNTVADAVKETGANTSIIFVPAPFAADAVYEAIDAGIGLVVCITERVPVEDAIKFVHYAQQHDTRLIGPNCPGLITPGQAKVGIIPGYITTPGPVGLVSRSGTLTYEVMWSLTEAGIGQTTAVGIGGDPVIGTTFIDALRLFQEDPQTKAIVLLGEIGGSDEERAAEFIKAHVTKPVVGFIAGRTAPEGKQMGHAGAIISGASGTAAAKIAALEAAGVRVADRPGGVAELMQGLI